MHTRQNLTVETKAKTKQGKELNGHVLSAVSLLEQFAKGKKGGRALTGNCVIYTRVSSKEQEEGYSLETQNRDCTAFAQKNDYNILGHFGGTYESAKTDERKEFNRMLQFIKRSKEKISYIIVYSIDRFSRSGANGIYIKEQLKGRIFFSFQLPSLWMRQLPTEIFSKTFRCFSPTTITSSAEKNVWEELKVPFRRVNG